MPHCTILREQPQGRDELVCETQKAITALLRRFTKKCLREEISQTFKVVLFACIVLAIPSSYQFNLGIYETHVEDDVA